MERLRHIGQFCLGILLAMTPLALWIAWTPALVLSVMLASIACAALLVLLTEPSQRNASLHLLPADFIDEVHRLFPLTYHHSKRETPRFRQAMRRLSEMMERDKAAR
jgi:hypothetical protein